jgi:hypothetical protein
VVVKCILSFWRTPSGRFGVPQHELPETAEDCLMQEQLLKAFQVLDCQAGMEDMLEACRSLFTHSDEYHLTQCPFDRSEVDAVANAIYEYILYPDAPSHREIVFNVHRQLEGRSIEYYEYGSRFSEDMLYQNFSPPFTSLDLEDLRLALKTFLVGILFRYQVCVDDNWFPVSVILNYIDAVRILLSREQRDSELGEALFATLAALRSLEPRYRTEEEATPIVEKAKSERTTTPQHSPNATDQGNQRPEPPSNAGPRN